MAKSSLIGALRVTLGMDTAQFEERANSMQRRLGGLQKKFERVAKGISAAGVAATGAMAVAVQKTINNAEELGRLAQIAGTSVEEFQKLAFATKSVGIEQDKLSDILKDVNDKFGDYLITGGGPLKDFFEQIAPKVGVTAEQFARLSGPEALQLYVKSLEQAGVSQAQMTFFMEALANDATGLLPLLRNNGTELNRLTSEAEKFGGVLSGKTTQEARRFNENLDKMKTFAQGVVNEVATNLLPSLVALTDQVVAFLKEGDKIETVGNAIVQVFKWIAGAVNDAVRDFSRLGAEMRYLKGIALDFFDKDAMAARRSEYEAELNRITGAWEKANEKIQGPQKQATAADFGLSLPGSDALSRWQSATSGALAGVAGDIAKSRGAGKGMFIPIDIAAQKEAAKSASDLAKKLSSEGQAVFDQTRTALEKYNIEVDRLNMLLQKGAIDQDTFNRAIGDAKETLQNAEKELTPIGQTLQSSFSGMFDSIIDGTFKASDAFKNLAKTIIKQFANKAISNLLGNLFNAGGKGGGGGGFLGGLFAGFFDGGGKIPSGKVGMVGEYGPEIVKGPASVVSRKDTANLMSGGGGQTIVVNAPGATAETVNNIKQAVAELNKNLERRAVGAVKMNQLRGTV